MKKCRDCGEFAEQFSRCRICQDKARVRQKKKSQERRIQGLCLRCGNISTLDSNYCELCLNKMAKYYKRRRQHRLDKNVCPECGQRSCAIDRKRCSECISEAKEKRAKVHLTRLDMNLCIRCGMSSPIGNKKRCFGCLDKARKLDQIRDNKLKESGMCAHCGRLPRLFLITRHNKPHTTCQKCYLKYVSQANLGSRKYADALLAKLEAQGYRCPYTGDDLVLGGNAWVDHIMPRDKFPELAHDIDNIEWVSEDANRMKHNRTPTEFLKLVEKIFINRKLCC